MALRIVFLLLMKNWIKAFRLRTLPLSFSTIITGSGCALLSGHWNTFIFILALTTTLFLQILSNLANDYGDFVKGTDNAQRVGPERALQSGSISQQQMFRAILLFIVFSLISGLSLIYIATQTYGWRMALFFLILGIASIAAALFYTIGKRAYGYSGLGDLFVFLFFGWVGVAGSHFLMTAELQFDIFLPASGIGLLSVAVLNMNNMRDHVNDKASGKNTLVVKMGFDAAKWYHIQLMVLAPSLFITWTSLRFESWFQFLFLLVSPLFIKNIFTVFSCKEPKQLDPELKRIAIGTFLLSLLFLTGQLLSL